MNKLLLAAVLLALPGVPLALLGAAFLAVEEHPLVAGGAHIRPEHVERAVVLLRRHDPRRARPGQLRTIQIGAQDVDLLANYAATRFGHGGARVVLAPGAATLRLALALPPNPFGRYLNVDAALAETAGLPRVESLTVGRLPVPAWLAQRLLEYAARRLSEHEAERAAADAIQSVSIADGTLRIAYQWRDDLPDRIRALAVPRADRERLRAYQERIAAASQDLRRGDSFTTALRPVMALAAERSSAGDAAAENRAAILALAFYANGKGLGALLPEARAWPQGAPRDLRLRGRGDLVRHFTISAALAATAGTPLSDAVGLYKEIQDARSGSGFSFSDLAADRAGTTFGQLAVRSAHGARRFSERAGARVSEADIMPEITGLADGMPEAEFKRRFGGVGAPAYHRVVQDIEQRVAACALYR
ncbi:MAG: hypothetical protein IT514_12990 [Burkholderiales bacterium]|nr:hypothetical protein [Burkholderiales bacterium]